MTSHTAAVTEHIHLVYCLSSMQCNAALAGRRGVTRERTRERVLCVLRTARSTGCGVMSASTSLACVTNSASSCDAATETRDVACVPSDAWWRPSRPTGRASGGGGRAQACLTRACP